ncbi:MAG: RecX family transcriptional regulator [Clostridiales bacterium]|nr:RecX family transcriptional regulator [Clostridiales bacterium]
MPKITDMQIQKNNKTRANVYIDGEFSMALEMLTVMKLGLKIGQDVAEERLAEAVFDSEKSVAFEKAMGYLGRGMKTVKQMRDYLTKKAYSPEVVDYVIRRLKEYRYIDDEEYAKTYVEHNSSTKGERRLKQELVSKGIALSLAEEHSQLDSEQALTDANRLAQKYMRSKPCDVKTLQKLQRYLLSRGYGYDTVNAVLRNYKLDNGTDD